MTSRIRSAGARLAVLLLLAVGGCGDGHPDIVGSWQTGDRFSILTFDREGVFLNSIPVLDTVLTGTYQWLEDGRLFMERTGPDFQISTFSVTIVNDTLILQTDGNPQRFVRTEMPQP